MATRTRQYKSAKEMAGGLEAYRATESAVMAWIPYTSAWSWAPTVHHELFEKPFLYTGLNQWSKMEMGQTSTRGDTVELISTGDKYRENAIYNEGTNEYAGGVMQNQQKTGIEKWNKIWKLNADIAGIGAGIYNAIRGGVSGFTKSAESIKTAKTALDVAKTASEASKIADSAKSGISIGETASAINTNTTASTNGVFNEVLKEVLPQRNETLFQNNLAKEYGVVFKEGKNLVSNIKSAYDKTEKAINEYKAPTQTEQKSFEEAAREQVPKIQIDFKDIIPAAYNIFNKNNNNNINTSTISQ